MREREEVQEVLRFPVDPMKVTGTAALRAGLKVQLGG